MRKDGEGPAKKVSILGRIECTICGHKFPNVFIGCAEEYTKVCIRLSEFNEFYGNRETLVRTIGVRTLVSELAI